MRRDDSEFFRRTENNAGFSTALILYTVRGSFPAPVAHHKESTRISLQHDLSRIFNCAPEGL
jgi:hypothetical protein